MVSRVSTIDQLKAHISNSGGFATKNLFSVSLPSFGQNAEEINLVCTGVQLPTRQITTSDTMLGVSQYKVGYGFMTQDVTMTFRVMNDQKIRKYFRDWQRLVISNSTKDLEYDAYNVGYYSNYVKTIKIHQLRKGLAFPVLNKSINLGLPPEIQNRLPSVGPFDFAKGEIDIDLKFGGDIVWTTELLEAYPVTVQQEAFVDDPNSGISELTVEFAYRDFKGYSSKQDEDGRNLVKAINFLGKIFNIF
jgi:hypothetical protein